MYFDDNTKLQLTYTHKIYVVRNNKKYYTETKDIKLGDEVMYSNQKLHKVTKIEKENIEETVYNIEVEKTHNFYVEDQQILVHNVRRALVINGRAIGKNNMTK